MRFGIPKYRLPRDVLEAEIQRIVDLGVMIELTHQGHERPRGESRRPVRCGLPRRRRAHRQARVHPGRQRGPDARCGLGAAQHGGRGEAAARPARRRLRRRQYRARRRAHGEAARRRPNPSSSTAARARRCPRTSRARRGAAGRRAGQVAVHDQAGRRGVDHRREDALDDKGNAQPTGEFETLAADSVVLALGQDVDLSLLDGVPGLEIEDGVVKVGAGHDDRPRRASSPAATWCRASAPSPSASATASSPRATSTRGCAARSGRTRPSHELATYDKLNTWYYSDAPKSQQPVLDPVRSAVDVRGSGRQLRRDDRAVRSAALPVLRQLLRVRQLLRRVPGQRRDQARPRPRYEFNYDYCKGCGLCVSECPAAPSRTAPEEI